jgi:hypothetical protein
MDAKGYVMEDAEVLAEAADEVMVSALDGFSRAACGLGEHCPMGLFDPVQRHAHCQYRSCRSPQPRLTRRAPHQPPPTASQAIREAEDAAVAAAALLAELESDDEDDDSSPPSSGGRPSAAAAVGAAAALVAASAAIREREAKAAAAAVKGTGRARESPGLALLAAGSIVWSLLGPLGGALVKMAQIPAASRRMVS